MRLNRDVNLQLLYPRMCSGHLQGRILTMLTSMIAPRNALELGTYAGYSAVCIAEGLPPEAHLDTVELGKKFDMVYMDANKRTYCETYRMILPLMNPGGFILADNTLWDGKVTDSGADDPQTDGIRRFNDMVARDDRVTRVILPLRDGLTLIRVRPDAFQSESTE